VVPQPDWLKDHPILRLTLQADAEAEHDVVGVNVKTETGDAVNLVGVGLLEGLVSKGAKTADHGETTAVEFDTETGTCAELHKAVFTVVLPDIVTVFKLAGNRAIGNDCVYEEVEAAGVYQYIAEIRSYTETVVTGIVGLEVDGSATGGSDETLKVVGVEGAEVGKTALDGDGSANCDTVGDLITDFRGEFVRGTGCLVVSANRGGGGKAYGTAEIKLCVSILCCEEHCYGCCKSKESFFHD